MRRYPTKRQRQIRAARLVAACCLGCNKTMVAHKTKHCVTCRKDLGLTLGPHGRLPAGMSGNAPKKASRKRQREINEARAERLRRKEESS